MAIFEEGWLVQLDGARKVLLALRDLQRLGRTQQMIDEPAIGGLRNATQGDCVVVLHHDLEVIAGLQMQTLSHRRRQHDLAFLGEDGRHSKNILHALKQAVNQPGGPRGTGQNLRAFVPSCDTKVLEKQKRPVPAGLKALAAD